MVASRSPPLESDRPLGLTPAIEIRGDRFPRKRSYVEGTRTHCSTTSRAHLPAQHLRVMFWAPCRGHKIMTSRNLYRGCSQGSPSVAALLPTPCSRAFEQVAAVPVRHTSIPGCADGEMR